MNDSKINEPPTPNVVSPHSDDGSDDQLDKDLSGRPAHELIGALGLSSVGGETSVEHPSPESVSNAGYEIVPDPHAEAVDLSELRGVKDKAVGVNPADCVDSDLDALEELVPDVRERRRSVEHTGSNGVPMTVSAGKPVADENAVEVAVQQGHEAEQLRKHSMVSGCSTTYVRNLSSPVADNVNPVDSMHAQQSNDLEDSSRHLQREASGRKGEMSPLREGRENSDGENYNAEDEASSNEQSGTSTGMYDGLGDGNSDDDDDAAGSEPKEVNDTFRNMSSAQSLSTATQTHQVPMPMYLPTFKPATGCTNASDFVVRCFVARLRAGITVVKHGRSRWCKSRLRILHIHQDGRSLSWKPAEGEPTSSKRPPKLDLSSCMEVRHAWSPDPQNPMYTGTPILRQKCEASNAHKSFALIFPKRTVDITAVTADQCKVLMEGFSALCFRLQVADLAGKQGGSKKGAVRGMPEEDGVSTTASATLTNSSTPRAR